jgi:hypothetical protein
MTVTGQPVHGSQAHTGRQVVTGTLTQHARYVVCGTYCTHVGAQGLHGAQGLQHVLQPSPP